MKVFNAVSIMMVLVMMMAMSFAEESTSYENYFQDLGLPNERSLEMIRKYETTGSMSTKTIMKKMKIKSVCLLIASLPWRYGPYQNQGYKLSLGLAKAGLKVYWMSFSSQHAIPKGVYRNVDELNRAVHLDYPPDDFGDVSHLTYLGYVVFTITHIPRKSLQTPTLEHKHRYGHGMDPNSLLVSDLNDRANEYGFDSYIILTDSNRVQRNVAYVAFDSLTHSTQITHSTGVLFAHITFTFTHNKCRTQIHECSNSVLVTVSSSNLESS